MLHRSYCIAVLVYCEYSENTLLFVPMNKRPFKLPIGFKQTINTSISVSRLWMDLFYGLNRVFE